ncbi:MAG: ferritin-like domain-containing protein [Helicobacteraceae bacterium]|nr:ferritin-like domain-containing protein [Helicobacteraceae bacterium]
MESKNLFSQIFLALDAKTAEEKCNLTQEIYKNFENLNLDKDTEILELRIPTYANFCQIVEPKRVPQGKYLKSDLNAAHLLHSLAHIEFSAIDLALDCAYRFRNLPKNYYFDWISVANEEVGHFMQLKNILESLGFKYGDFFVHSVLFDSLKKCNVLLDRIALVPRGMEAVGLDVNPFLCAKVQNSKHKIKNELLQVLKIILNDEISHVKKGDIWFKYFCDTFKIPANLREKTYIDILKKYNFSFPKANATLNETARLKAGFSKSELELLKLESKNAFVSRNPK